MRDTGHPPQVAYLKATDHFFTNEEGRTQTLRALDGFLAKHLSGARTPGS